jgi:hypothetical protein
VPQCGLVIYIKKYLKEKGELWKLKYLFRHAKIESSKRIPLKETRILQDIIIILINNLKFQHKPKYIIFQKSSCKNK